MRILFLHPNFPAQFRHVAAALAKDKDNQVFFGTTRQEFSLPDVNKVIYSPTREAHPQTHHYVRPLENAVLQGQSVYRLAEKLKAQGFIPDVMVCWLTFFIPRRTSQVLLRLLQTASINIRSSTPSLVAAAEHQ